MIAKWHLLWQPQANYSLFPYCFITVGPLFVATSQIKIYIYKRAKLISLFSLRREQITALASVYFESSCAGASSILKIPLGTRWGEVCSLVALLWTGTNTIGGELGLYLTWEPCDRNITHRHLIQPNIIAIITYHISSFQLTYAIAWRRY